MEDLNYNMSGRVAEENHRAERRRGLRGSGADEIQVDVRVLVYSAPGGVFAGVKG